MGGGVGWDLLKEVCFTPTNESSGCGIQGGSLLMMIGFTDEGMEAQRGGGPTHGPWGSRD